LLFRLVQTNKVKKTYVSSTLIPSSLFHTTTPTFHHPLPVTIDSLKELERSIKQISSRAVARIPPPSKPTSAVSSEDRSDYFDD